MRISLSTAGTRGDTQPVVVLASELQQRGHDVSVLASPNTLDLAVQAGIPCRGIGPDSEKFLKSDVARQAMARGETKEHAQAMLDELVRAWDLMVEVMIEDAREADVIVSTLLTRDAASVAADALRLPLLGLDLTPGLPNRVHSHPLVTPRILPGPLSWATGWLFERVWWQTVGPLAERSRESLGLAPAGRPLRQRHRQDPFTIQAWDPVLSPGLDLGAFAPLVGQLAPTPSLRTELDGKVDAPLDQWIDAGDPPLFFGFGSMPVIDPSATLRLIVETSRRRGRRALISAGWSDFDAEDVAGEDVLVVGDVDHARILPRCAVAVHHGGIGTLQASLAAGVPTVVVAVWTDQLGWAKRVPRLGVGAGLRYKDLDSRTLGRALEVALRPDTAARARVVAEQMVDPAVARARTADLVEQVGSRRASQTSPS